MSAIVFSAKQNFVEFTWEGKSLRYKGRNQHDIDSIDKEQSFNDYLKEYIPSHLEGEAKDDFISEAYSMMTAVELFDELESMLVEAKKGK